MFLHGWGANGKSFARAKEEFSADFNVYTPDFKGFGTEPEPHFSVGIYKYAADMAIYIQNEIKSNVHLVGHSFGGRVAIVLAAKYPNLVKSLILVDSAGIRPKLTHKQKKSIQKYKALKDAVQNGRADKEILKDYGSNDYKGLSDVMKGCFVKVVNEDLTHLLPQINVKTMIFWGKYDKDTPLYMAKKMKKLIPQSKLKIVKGGHYSFLDCEKEFFNSCYDFWGF